MKEVSIIGVDPVQAGLATPWSDGRGRGVFRKKLPRKQFLAFMQAHPGCQVAMEACATAHHWARTLADLGHEVPLIAPKFVKPYLKNQKNDMAEAEATVEAASRPTMRFVPVKTEEAQAAAMVFRVRELLIRQRTQAISALRGHLAESGQMVPQGAAHAARLTAIVEDPMAPCLPMPSLC